MKAGTSYTTDIARRISDVFGMAASVDNNKNSRGAFASLNP